jgi:hypothetical protein
MLSGRILGSLFALLLLTAGVEAGSAKIIKVLPHYLDTEGRHSLSPSLFERDAYQAWFREHPEKRSALRFDVNWKGGRTGLGGLILRMELRGSAGSLEKPLVLERPVKPTRLFRKWSSLTLEGDAYRNLGTLLAWRASLWQDGHLVAERKSFLW